MSTLTTTAALPAALVVYHKDAKIATGKQILSYNNWQKGFTGFNGIRESHGYRGYYYNMDQTFSKYTLNKVQKTSLKFALLKKVSFLCRCRFAV